VGRRPKTQKQGFSAKDLSWEDAIQRVLAKADGALHYTEIAERIVSNGLRTSVGATPAQTVASHLSYSLREDSSPYLRVGRGEYTLRTIAEKGAQDQLNAGKVVDQVAETGALRAFGMFWQRELVLWPGTRLLGRQGAGATEVNFAGQVGVYLLHDRERVIYVGRATDSLFARLKTHTLDRLGGRWDRFSWFGLRSVNAKGELSNSQVPWDHDVVVETMEALLIESLEPPLNRRRGDNFSGIEYIQATDPEIETAKKKAIIEELSKSLRL
jgi:HB1, ASXL, restriction endonuclease HTH domain